MTQWEIISLALNLLFGGGLVMLMTIKSTRKKSEAEATDTEEKAKGSWLENIEKSADITMKYIVEPLKKEMDELREELAQTRRELAETRVELAETKEVLEEIKNCPDYPNCPARNKLQSKQAGKCKK